MSKVKIVTLNEKNNFSERQAVANKVLASCERNNLPQWYSGMYEPQDMDGKKFKDRRREIFVSESNKHGYKDPRWLTFYETQKLGAKIKQGVNYITVPVCVKDNNNSIIKMIAYYNAEQCTGLEQYVPRKLQKSYDNEIIEKIIANSAVPIVYDGANPCYYSLNEDKIHSSKPEKFDTK